MKSHLPLQNCNFYISHLYYFFNILKASFPFKVVQRMKCAAARGSLEPHHSRTGKELVTPLCTRRISSKNTLRLHCDSKCCFIAKREQELSFSDTRNTSVQPMEQSFPSIKSRFKQGGTSYFAKISVKAFKIF